MDARGRRLAKAERLIRLALGRERAASTLLKKARLQLSMLRSDESPIESGLGYQQRVLRAIDSDLLGHLRRLSEVSP